MPIPDESEGISFGKKDEYLFIGGGLPSLRFYHDPAGVGK